MFLGEDSDGRVKIVKMIYIGVCVCVCVCVFVFSPKAKVQNRSKDRVKFLQGT